METTTPIENFKFSDRKDFVAIRRTLDGDVNAYEYLFEKYQKHIYYSMLRKTRNVEVAADLTLIALTKAFERLHQYKVQKTFNSWISRVANNVAVDFFRDKAKRVPTLSLDAHLSFSDSNDDESKNASGTSYDVDGGFRDGEQELIRSERHSAVHAAVEKLDGKAKEVVELVYFQEMSYQEASDITGMSLSNVKTTLFRAKKKLKKHLRYAKV